jgi:tetratricopeptide (TPR) repeat protein
VEFAESGERPKVEMIEEVRTLVDRAMKIDPDNGYTIIVSSYPDAGAERNLPVVIDSLKRGLAKDSSDLQSLRVASDLLRLIGRNQRSVEIMQHVVERDPLCAFCLLQMARNHLVLGNYDRAEQLIRRFRQTTPQGGTHTLGTILFLKGEYQQAADVFATLEEPANPRFVVLHGQAMTAIALNNAELLANATAELRANFYDVDPLGLAEIYALTGDNDAAFEALDHAFETNPRMQYVTYQRVLLRNLHDDPRWTEFREKTGTSEEALARMAFDIEIAGER